MKTLFAVGLFVLVAILLQVVCVETQQQQLPESNADVEPSCILCQFIVVQLTKIINQSEPEIEKALLKVCKLLPLEAEQVVRLMRNNAKLSLAGLSVLIVLFPTYQHYCSAIPLY